MTVALPDAGKRFMSLMVINQETVYTLGDYTYTREQIGTGYLFIAVRTLVDPADPEDVKQAQALQDANKVSQPGGPGTFEAPNWDKASQDKVRDALLVLNETLPVRGMSVAGRKRSTRSGTDRNRGVLGLEPGQGGRFT